MEFPALAQPQQWHTPKCRSTNNDAALIPSQDVPYGSPFDSPLFVGGVNSTAPPNEECNDAHPFSPAIQTKDGPAASSAMISSPAEGHTPSVDIFGVRPSPHATVANPESVICDPNGIFQISPDSYLQMLAASSPATDDGFGGPLTVMPQGEGPSNIFDPSIMGYDNNAYIHTGGDASYLPKQTAPLSSRFEDVSYSTGARPFPTEQMPSWSPHPSQLTEIAQVVWGPFLQQQTGDIDTMTLGNPAPPRMT